MFPKTGKDRKGAVKGSLFWYDELEIKEILNVYITNDFPDNINGT